MSKKAIGTVRCLWSLVSVSLPLVSSRVLTHFEVRVGGVTASHC